VRKLDIGFVLTALLAVAFGALLSRFARDKLSNNKTRSSEPEPLDLDRSQDKAD